MQNNTSEQKTYEQEVIRKNVGLHLPAVST